MISRHHLARLAPRALPVYLDAFEFAGVTLPKWSINTPLRAAHALAQWLHETGGLTILEERLSYSADRLMAVWPHRFPTMAKACLYDRDPEGLANFVYAGRMGNAKPGDGWRFRGRGLIQLTGRANYARYGEMVKADLIASPDLAASSGTMLDLAGAYWKAKNINALADADDLPGITKALNGGLIGIDSRKHWLDRVKAALL